MIAQDTRSPDPLLPDGDLFDETAVAADLERAVAESGGSAATLRRSAAAVLAEARRHGSAAIADALHANPFAADAAASAHSRLADRLLEAVMDLVRSHLHPLSAPTGGERLAVFAVGGYGRGQMAPHSDVDLLFLTPGKITPWAESAVESALYILWDMRLKIGHATRSLDECLRLEARDATVRTSLLERRFVSGDAALAKALDDGLAGKPSAADVRAFVKAKLAERAQRHERHGARYMVEPNVKEGKGGLRDLQSLFWIAKYLHGGAATPESAYADLFSAEELGLFAEAESFLLAVRCQLHILAGRAAEKLSFDLQVAVAERLGYAGAGRRQAVEVFMQDYFRHAAAVGDLTRIFLTKLESAYAEPNGAAPSGPSLAAGYAEVGGRLAVADEAAFLTDRLNLLRLFEEGLRTGLLIHPDAMRLVRSNLHMIDDAMRADPKANRIFLDLLLGHGNPERALRRMNELGALSAFIPEFEDIRAMMQFNMYHSYTVDEHTIQCIGQLSRIERGELVEDLPVASSILAGGVNRRVLYVALLLHDIGKGREESHSELGARIAERLAPRLGLDAAESEDVEWLVRHHLLMSDTAQRRDIADPRTVRDFAKQVRTRERLDLLLALTACDIRGVGPEVWNNWKATLLRSLHEQTALALGDEDGAAAGRQRGADARERLRATLSEWDAAAIDAEIARHGAPYWEGLDAAAHAEFARMLREIREDGVELRLAPDADRDATRACFALADQRGLFNRLCGALAMAGANVVEARTYTSEDGFATAAFWIQDAAGRPYGAERRQSLHSALGRTLAGGTAAAEIGLRDRIRKSESAFSVPTRIAFDNKGSDIHTIVEVAARDRPGLLFDLTRALERCNVRISSAVISTYGERAVDSFYVKDPFGLKLSSAQKLGRLEREVREAIETGVERAALQ